VTEPGSEFKSPEGYSWTLGHVKFVELARKVKPPPAVIKRKKMKLDAMPQGIAEGVTSLRTRKKGICSSTSTRSMEKKRRGYEDPSCVKKKGAVSRKTSQCLNPDKREGTRAFECHGSVAGS